MTKTETTILESKNPADYIDRSLKARLTPAGQHLLEYAHRILDEMQHARSDLKAMEKRGESRAPGIWQTLAGG